VTGAKSSADFSPSWTADGRILFTSDRAADVVVEVANSDGSGRRVVAESPGVDALPRWSPDGKRLAFVSDRAGNPEIYVSSATGAGVRRLTHNKLEDVQPTWSPDGRRIAFLRGDAERAHGLYVMNADGRRLRPVLLFDKNDDAYSPAWSPDGRRIAFTLDDQIVVVTADGGRLSRVATGSGDDADPSWSPDGRRIVFDSSRDDDWDIYVVSSRGGAAKRLTRMPGPEAYPDWSPDGRLIAFTTIGVSLASFSLQATLYVMNANGTDLRPVPLPVPAFIPDWQPLK